MDWLPAIKIAIAFIILAMASRSDWLTREASDKYWILIGLVGLLFLGIQIYSDGVNALYYLTLIPIAIIFLDTFLDRPGLFEDGLNLAPVIMYGTAACILGFLLYEFGTAPYLWQLLIAPIMMVVFILLYKIDIIKGGADAKALMALSILFPTYPVFSNFPLISIPTNIPQFVFPYPLLLLFNAAILVLAIPLAMFFYNLAKRNVRFPAMFLGYPMSTSDAKSKFVWPMEYVEDGEIKMTLFPKDPESTIPMIDELEAAGKKEIWVTPKVPFLIPLTVSIIFSAVVGNILFLIL